MKTNRPGSSLGIILRLLGFVRPFWKHAGLSILCGLATIAAGIGLVATSAYLISAAALHPSIAELQVAIVGVRFFGITRAGFRYLERLLSHSVNLSLLARLRVWLYARIEPLAPARTQDLDGGDLLARLVADVDTLENFYVRAAAPAAIAGLVCAGMAVFLGSFRPGLGVVLLLALAAVGLGLPLAVRWVSREEARRLVDQRAELNTQIVDGIQGCADLLAFGCETAYAERFAGLNRENARTQRRMAWIQGAHSGLSVLLANLGGLALLALAIPLVRAGTIRGVDLAVIVLGGLAAFEAVYPLPLAAQTLGSCLQAARRLFELADLPPAVSEPEMPCKAPEAGEITILGVSFAYPRAPSPSPPPKGEGKARLALMDINLEIQKGKKVAIVGASGAGKSTLFQLLLRFWEPDCGEIRIGGVDIREIAADDLRRGLVGVISQRTVVFNQTVRENLLLARPEAAIDEVIRAAQRARIHDRIIAMPQGYDTWIGERGLRLSAGERQRLAIARALLQDAPILLMDEPAANLDALTERQVLDTLFEGVFPGRSVLWITHRLARLDGMDEILVMDRGQIVERGTHAQLLAESGVYHNMWKTGLQCFPE